MRTREKELDIYLKSVLYVVRGHEVYSDEVGSKPSDVRGESAWARYYFTGKPCKYGMMAVRDKFTKCCCSACRNGKTRRDNAQRMALEIEREPINLDLDKRKLEIKEAPRLRFVPAAQKMEIVNSKIETLLNGVFK